MSSLRAAFKRYREGEPLARLAIDIIKSDLFIISSGKPTSSPLLAQGPKANEWCVTASEQAAPLKQTGQEICQLNGRSIISTIRTGVGLLIIHPDGGDYLSASEIETLKQALHL